MLVLGSLMSWEWIGRSGGAIPLLLAARFGSPRDPGRRPAPLCFANRNERKTP
jgi:hypothetical protein